MTENVYKEMLYFYHRREQKKRSFLSQPLRYYYTVIHQLRNADSLDLGSQEAAILDSPLTECLFSSPQNLLNFGKKLKILFTCRRKEREGE
jgi:hypothetical protein